MKKIAVEPVLSGVSTQLQEYGFEVVDLVDENLKNVDAYIISGMDKNVLGIQQTATELPVIIASGLTPLEIRRELEKRLYQNG
ncbi:MAG: YkuS family protein [Halanaerobiales bacterium]